MALRLRQPVFPRCLNLLAEANLAMNQVSEAMPLLSGYNDQRWKNERRQTPAYESHYQGPERREALRRKFDRRQGHLPRTHSKHHHRESAQQIEH